MAFEGMDTDLAQSQATQLQSQGVDGVQQLISQIDGLVNQIEGNWKGADATNFQTEWNSTLRSQLHNVQQSLSDFHTTFNTNIQQQISASAN
jgi:uncharacterized protein YukE